MDADSVGEVEGRSPFDRRLAVLLGIAAVVASLLATAQVGFDRQAGQASSRATRLATRLFEGLTGTGLLTSFQFGSLLQANEGALASSARQVASFDHPDVAEVELAIGKASETASLRALKLAGEMGSAPAASTGLDPHTLSVLTRTTRQLQADVAEQGALVDRAQRFSARSDRVVFALSLLAISGVLLGLAAVMKEGQPGRVSLWSAAAILVLSVLVGSSAFLI